jgi:glycine cleavage system H protein
MDPASLRYAQSHEWVAVAGDIATVGITSFAVQQLTDLVYVELPKIGRQLKAGEPFGEIESVKAVSDLYAPVTGEVVEVNGALKSDAMKIAADPYGTGWLIKLRVASNTTLDHLLTLDQYQKQLAEEQH